MRMRTTVSLAALLLAALLAAPAHAKLVYVEEPATADPVVYVATDKGKRPKRLGIGRAPAISPDGRWVAFITVPKRARERQSVVLKRLNSGAQRLVMRAKSISSLRFSPDSGRVSAVVNERRIRVYDIDNDKHRIAATGDIRGYSWAPDSKRVVFGEAASDDLQAKSDLYIGRAMGGADPDRLTRSKDAVNPVWGPEEIFYDRFTRRDDVGPAYQIWAIEAAGGDPRQLTSVTVPPLFTGFVPLEVSADGRRMLAALTGTDVQAGFTVNTGSGDTKAFTPENLETGIVGFDLAADGKTVLGHTGGPDPANAHDVVTVPYAGGDPTVLVEGGAYPDWTR
jgi:Tol biopolymer transport system component